MALDPIKFHTNSGGGRQIHSYSTTDAIATVSASGYFNAITGRLHQGDTVIVGGGAGGVAEQNTLIVASATGAPVVTTIVGA